MQHKPPGQLTYYKTQLIKNQDKSIRNLFIIFIYPHMYSPGKEKTLSFERVCEDENQ